MAEMSTNQDGPFVLVVDDDDVLLRTQARALAANGFRVETAVDGAAATRALESTSFDVILSDIVMPGLNGLELLERVRAHDLDVPVVLMTGSPSVDTAVRAVEQGAHRYLLKPVELDVLLRVLGDAARAHTLATARRQALELAGGLESFLGDHAELAASFGEALKTLFLAYQPVVSWSRREVVGYEALLRSREPSLPHPLALLDTAERLGRVYDLGRRIRTQAIEPLQWVLADTVLFLNVHPGDLHDEQLFAAQGPLADVADHIILEIAERSALDGMTDIRERFAALRSLGFRVAIDDLGGGHGGAKSLTLLEPDLVKLDRALVRGLDLEPGKRDRVRAMISTCEELGITVISKGVETPGERDVLASAGCDLMQGYLFARPGEAFPVPSF